MNSVRDPTAERKC